MAGKLSQYARNVGALVGQSLIQRVLGMLTTVILARTLGAAGLGAYTATINTGTSVFSIVRLGVEASVFVRTAEPHPTPESRRLKGEMLAAGLLILMVTGLVG